MTDTIDDFRDLKELLNSEGYIIRDASFDADPNDGVYESFDVEFTLIRERE